MKKILLVLAIVFLSGCVYNSLTSIHNKYGPPTRVEITCADKNIVCDEEIYNKNKEDISQIIWYYYWPTRQSRGAAIGGPGGGVAGTSDYSGWLCWRIVADKNGDVISHSKYIESASKSKQSTDIETGPKKLPGIK